MINKDKLLIVGSPARILNSNYFSRKIDFYKKKYRIILILDSYVFHDEKENTVRLSNKFIIKKFGSNSEWEKLLENKVSYYSSIIKGFKLKKWNQVITRYHFDNFIKLINPEALCIDILKCPICSKSHVGPFKIYKKCVIYKTEKIPISCLNHFNCRIKYGYIQFLLAKKLKTKVLLNEKYYEKNLDIINRLNIGKYVIINRSKSIPIKIEQYVDSLFEDVKIPFTKKRNIHIVKWVGIRNYMKILEREKMRKIFNFKKADEIRENLLRKNIKIEDGKNQSFLIIRRRV